MNSKSITSDMHEARTKKRGNAQCSLALELEIKNQGINIWWLMVQILYIASSYNENGLIWNAMNINKSSVPRPAQCRQPIQPSPLLIKWGRHNFALFAKSISQALTTPSVLLPRALAPYSLISWSHLPPFPGPPSAGIHLLQPGSPTLLNSDSPACLISDTSSHIMPG